MTSRPSLLTPNIPDAQEATDPVFNTTNHIRGISSVLKELLPAWSHFRGLLMVNHRRQTAGVRATDMALRLGKGAPAASGCRRGVRGVATRPNVKSDWHSAAHSCVPSRTFTAFTVCRDSLARSQKQNANTYWFCIKTTSTTTTTTTAIARENTNICVLADLRQKGDANRTKPREKPQTSEERECGCCMKSTEACDGRAIEGGSL